VVLWESGCSGSEGPRRKNCWFLGGSKKESQQMGDTSQLGREEGPSVRKQLGGVDSPVPKKQT